MKLNFFSDSHLAPKFFKVVANSEKVGRHFQRQTKPFFYAVIVLEIKLGKRSLMCYKVDTRMDDMQSPSSQNIHKTTTTIAGTQTNIYLSSMRKVRKNNKK